MSSRYQLRSPDALRPDQYSVYEAIIGGPRSGHAPVGTVVDTDGALLGPFGPMSLAGPVGDRVQALGAALRYATSIDPATREAATLLVAVRHRCEFEWYAHAPIAADLGLSVDDLARIWQGGLPSPAAAVDHHLLTVVQAMLSDGNVADAEYRSVQAGWGEDVLAELVWLVGYYSMLALALAVFDPPAPEQLRSVFAEPAIGEGRLPGDEARP